MTFPWAWLAPHELHAPASEAQRELVSEKHASGSVRRACVVSIREHDFLAGSDFEPLHGGLQLFGNFG